MQNSADTSSAHKTQPCSCAGGAVSEAEVEAAAAAIYLEHDFGPLRASERGQAMVFARAALEAAAKVRGGEMSDVWHQMLVERDAEVARLHAEIEWLRRARVADLEEIERLRAAKRRALQVADERSKENVQLRAVLALRCPQLVADADAEPPRIYGDMYW